MTCSTTTVMRGEAQLRRHCEHLIVLTGKYLERLWEMLNPVTGECTTRIVVPKLLYGTLQVILTVDAVSK